MGLFTSRHLPEGTPVAAYHGLCMTVDVYNEIPVDGRITSYVHDVDIGPVQVIILPLNGFDPYHPHSCTAAWANEAPFGMENNMRMQLLKVPPTLELYCINVNSLNSNVLAGEELMWYYGRNTIRSNWYASTDNRADALAGTV